MAVDWTRELQQDIDRLDTELREAHAEIAKLQDQVAVLKARDITQFVKHPDEWPEEAKQVAVTYFDYEGDELIDEATNWDREGFTNAFLVRRRGHDGSPYLGLRA